MKPVGVHAFDPVAENPQDNEAMSDSETMNTSSSKSNTHNPQLARYDNVKSRLRS